MKNELNKRQVEGNVNLRLYSRRRSSSAILDYMKNMTQEKKVKYSWESERERDNDN